MYILLVLGAVASSSAFLESFFEPNTCPDKQFACRNGKCIDTTLRCDGFNNCIDGSDEMECDFFLCREPQFHRCNNHRCISKSFVCDGDNDCEDFSDEVDCENSKMSHPLNSTCENGHWQCSDKLCIPNEWVCNGEADCLDSSDEGIGCSSKIECDGFKCKNGHCIPNEWRCDDHDDCNDNSDEEDCENHFPIDKCTMDNRKFLCSNNKTCIDLNKVCDNHTQCPDGSDEGTLCKAVSLSCKNHGCSHECFQLPTGPKCLCPPGYLTKDDKNCQDINECEQFDICDQKCRNLPGSYECYCDHKYMLKEDKKTCKAVGGEALMIFSSKSEIRAYALFSELYFPVAKQLKQVVGVDYDGHHIYWTDIFAEHESIVRTTEDGSKREILITAGLGLPEDLSVDWLTGNIYFTDAEKEHIGVCTSDGSHCTVLVNKDVNRPRGIVLNVEEGDMYWTDWAKPARIGYSLMDGSNDRAFISADIHWPNGLALDQSNQRLYWTDAKKMTLESIRLDGTDRRVVLKGVVKHPYAIAVFENKLYWSDWATHSIQACDKFTGKNHHTIVKEEHEYIYGISIYHSALHRRLDNPCALSFCSHICLLKGKTYSCACPENMLLGSDNHNCRDSGPKEMLIAGTKDSLVHIEHKFLGKHDVTYLPTVAKNIGCLAYDSFNNSLIISDIAQKKIISLDMDNGINKILEIDGLGNVTAMDYDPKGNNLYVCDREKGTLEVISLNTLSRKILLHDMNGEIPEAIAVVPDEGVMFVVLRDADWKSCHLDRFYMDGTGRTHTLEDHLVGPVSLHYDHELNRVFFADAGLGLIESTSVEGDDRHEFRKLTTKPVSITTLNKDLFWVNAKSKRLYWSEKKSPSPFNRKITLDLTEEPDRLHVISVTPRRNLIGACRINNNGCSHLCLLSHKSTVCACPTGFEISFDNRTCMKRLHCDDKEFFCPQSNVCISKISRCNGHKDCAFGEDEYDCDTNKCPSGYFRCDSGDCIKEELVCNHHYDCKDKSDEGNCADRRKKLGCPSGQFKCGNGECVSNRFVCDGYKDCKDGSDEMTCEKTFCSDTQFRCDSGTCIPKSWECDHEYDCSDFSDEHSGCASITCSPTTFTCENGKCLDKKLVCDNSDDCGDNSDEMSCFTATNHCASNEFPCTSNTSICIPMTAKCNGSVECPKGEDEQECGECMAEEFRCLNKKCVPIQWTCDGLDDCGDSSDETTERCLQKNKTMAGLAVVHASCENGFRCKNGDCLDLKLICDGKHDCYDGSDEDGLCSTSCDGPANRCSHICNKTPMGPSCACKPGFKLMGDGFSCMDVDECHDHPPVCSQLCHNHDGGFNCDCYDGFLLRSDKKSCKAEGTPMSVIFSADGEIRELSQKTNILSIVFSTALKITGLDVLFNPSYIYFSMGSTSTIHRVDMVSKTRHFIKNIGQPQDIAVDWSTQNVYYYNAETVSKSISVCNFEEKCAKLIDIDIHRQMTGLVVDSVNKVLFYALNSWYVFNSPSYIIYRCNLDGTERTEIVKTTSGFVSDITFDHYKKRVYYTDHHSSEINMMTYDGTLRTPIYSNITRPSGLKFFENRLYYSTNGGFIFVCRLFGFLRCESFRLHSYPIEFFSITQETLQPAVGNPCKNHSCSNVCVPSQYSYKCLCHDGTLVAESAVCSTSEHAMESDKKHTVHTVPMIQVTEKNKGSGVVVAAVLVPLILICIAVGVVHMIKKKHLGGMNVRMRFYNPLYGRTVEDETPILRPGQHEYTNPVHFNKEDNALTLEKSPKELIENFSV